MSHVSLGYLTRLCKVILPGRIAPANETNRSSLPSKFHFWKIDILSYDSLLQNIVCLLLKRPHFLSKLRKGIKIVFFTVRLTVRVDPPSSRSAERDFFLCVCKKQMFFLVQKHYFLPFLVGQKFHICLQSGRRGLTPPFPLTVSLTVKYPGFFC